MHKLSLSQAQVLATRTCLALCTALLGACTSVGTGTGTGTGAGFEAGVGRHTVLKPRTACAAMSGHRVPAASIALPTRGAVVASAVLVASAGLVPEHCKLLGDILPIDAQAPNIKFQLNVPTAWNGNIIQVGGGGLNGAIPANLAALAGAGSPVSAAQPPDAPFPISRGYAMFGGDSGHQGTAGDWALNDEAWLNFAHAGLKKTHDAAFAVVLALYGSRPRVSYFMGQSQGGREALEVTQRYPADYDGVVATAPLIGYTPHVVAKTLFATMQTGAGWISPDKAKAIGAEVLRQCDALDGLLDGVISNHAACNARLQIERLRCDGGADLGAQCLSDAQLNTAQALRAPLRLGFELAHGDSEFPGYGTGREAVAWLNITPQPGLPARPNLGEPGLPARPNLGQPGTTVQYGILKDPAFNLLNFSTETAREKIIAASKLLDATNTDLSAFFARGGKLLVKSNAADYSVNPQTLQRYFDQVVARYGRKTVDAHLRYYVLPGAGHNGDGASATTGEPIAQYVDLVTMMTDWVEAGRVPPDAPVLVSKTGATQPLCRHPLYPRYGGSGDARRAESWRCTAP